MKKERARFGVLNIILTVMIIVIVILIVSIYLYGYYRDRSLDLSYSYTPSTVNENEYGYGETFAEDLVVSNTAVAAEGVTLNASTEKALLFNLDSKTSLFAQGIYDQAYPASLAKLMTAILILKYGNLDDDIVITSKDLDLEEGAQVTGLRSGDIVTLDQLFYALVIYSGNDAAMAAARHVGGSVENFVKMMNDEADELGLLGTHFTNPHGLHESGNYSCAYDVYIMLNELIKYDHFRDAMTLNMYQLKIRRGDGTITYNLDSTDKYATGEKSLPEGISSIAVRTGSTTQAGACIAMAFQNVNGVPYIAVLMNASNSSILYEDMIKLFGIIS